MCGIIAVLRRPSGRVAPPAESVLAELDAVLGELRQTLGDLSAGGSGTGEAAHTDLGGLAGRLEAVDRLLRGTPGTRLLIGNGDLAPADALAGRVAAVDAELAETERRLDDGQVELDPAELEQVNAAMIRLKDAAWSLGRDRVRTARAVADLAGCEDGPPGVAALDAFWSVQVALSSLDRLEVRGRDSAGLHLLVTDHGLDTNDPAVRALMSARIGDPLFTSMAVRTPAGHLSFVYKAAAEIGELGDNTRWLRTAIRSDVLLHWALRQPAARCVVLGHTRWASVGVISQPNAHPLNSEELGAVEGPYVTAVLNGDVDNYLDLRLSEGLRLPAEVTTDAKVIPTLVSRRLGEGIEPLEAVRQTVSRFEGSVAIGLQTAAEPNRLYLALRGSGQSLNIGLAEDAFVVASEPYGIVEETSRYLRMDGEAAGGQLVVLDLAAAGSVEGITRLRYDGSPLPVEASELQVAEITTRDIDRGGAPHFLLKEISEAPQSFRKTLRGKIVPDDRFVGRLAVRLGDETLPPELRRAVGDGTVRRVLVVGQGTAAVAGQSVAAALSICLADQLPVTALPATELSGFGLVDDMSDTLVVAISQSGTTTDTNRTVDLVRARGARVIAVVNRRNSDLVEKADGVLYTSDGRDVEMSVASTKAFYAQVAAGFLLALALADCKGCSRAERTDQLLNGLRSLPEAMEQVLAARKEIAEAAKLALPRRYWAVVGSGPDRIAASEIRIKLSELCYKSIACDATEDKKHIDLSSEPLVVVCAAGLSGANADDVAKEIAIYRAHKAVPVVIARAGEEKRFSAAVHTITVPAVDPTLAFVLSAMVGHLFGYEAALAIDGQARPLREARAGVEAAIGAAGADGDGADLQAELASVLLASTNTFLGGVRAGAYNGHMEAATAVRLVSLLRYATGALPIEGYELEYGKVGSPAAVVGDLLDALTAGIEELTRPVDAIKHQAKTVTVGISRSEDALLAVPLVKEVLAAGASPGALSYRALRTLAELDVAVDACLGYTRYRIGSEPGGLSAGLPATIAVTDRGGVAATMTSRTERDPRLRGTKHRAADEREVTVAKGRSDGRTVVLVPEVEGNQVTGMTLIHVSFKDHLPVPQTRQVLSGYRNRYAAISDAVTETEPSFDDSRLADVPLVDLLTEPVYVLAERWWRSVP